MAVSRSGEGAPPGDPADPRSLVRSPRSRTSSTASTLPTSAISRSQFAQADTRKHTFRRSPPVGLALADPVTCPRARSWPAWSLRENSLLIDLENLKELSLDERTGILTCSPSSTGWMVNVDYLSKFGRMFAGGEPGPPFVLPSDATRPAADTPPPRSQATVPPSPWAASSCKAVSMAYLTQRCSIAQSELTRPRAQAKAGTAAATSGRAS